MVKRRLKKININCPSCGYQKSEHLKCPNCGREVEVENCFKYLEKGVDVKLAITFLLDAIENKFDKAIVCSSDADYVPAISHVVKKLKKDVIYCHFPSPKTSELIQTCSSRRLITKDMVERAQINYKGKNPNQK